MVGYEFPGITEDAWDSEWLIVAGEVSCARGRWSFRDPCLLTLEVEALATWLAELRLGGARSVLAFIEPNLRFTYVELGGGAVSVAFSQEASPPWANDDERYGEGCALTFPLSCNDVAVASAALQSMLRTWPTRTRNPRTG